MQNADYLVGRPDCDPHAGASGGVASAHQTVAPQFIPISQLVLMTIKAEKESEV